MEALNMEKLQALGEKMSGAAEELKAQSETVLHEGRKILRRARKEFRREFDQHPIAMVATGVAITGALVWLLTRRSKD